jgi:hypothetical protein
VKDQFEYKKYKIRERFFDGCRAYFVPEAAICMLNGCSNLGVIDEAYEYFSNYY